MPVLPLRSRLCLALAAAIALPAGSALAQRAEPPPAASEDVRHHEPQDLDRIVVKSTPLSRTAEDLTRPVEVLAGERLDAAKATSLGETVNKLPGVQSSFFGPSVGRPVIRGMEGARVQVLSNGLGTGDVSTVSADHAVSVEPFLADQVEVLKGPSTLLYGSGAIGGAVNVVDGRIPEQAPIAPFSGRAEARLSQVNRGSTVMLRTDGAALDDRLLVHFDVLHRETGDTRIPGFPESAALLAEEGETPDPATKGTLPGSAVRTHSGALGISWVGARGFIGIGSALFDTRYGIPGHAHEGHEHEDAADEDHDAHGAGAEEGVRIALDQRRHELRAGLDDIGWLKSLRFKLARTDYTHSEFEDGTVGTVFDNRSTDGRLELAHQPVAGWNGAFGLQTARRDFGAVGEEAFVPGSRSRDTGLFWLGERAFGPLTVELGARHDRNSIAVDAASGLPDRDFRTTSLSAAARWNISEAFHLSLGLDRAQRPPTPEELYSSGLHVATRSFEFGRADLGVETATGIELGLHWHAGPVRLQGSVYRVGYRDYIYLAPTDLAEDGIPVRAWAQEDARFTGAEASIDWDMLDNASGLWTLHAFGDVVRGDLRGSGSRTVLLRFEHEDMVHEETATLLSGGPLPRIAPARIGAELLWRGDAWRASLGAVRVMRQDRVAQNESPTAGYLLVDAHLAWHRDTAAGHAWEVFLDGRNLLDREARVHTSFLKDLAPLPGRGIDIGLRLFF